MEKGYLRELNQVQQQAVEDYMGPSLIIAGAGSGKTKVLTCRIARLLEEGISPGAVLALTFTNKAAKEMKERIALLVGGDKAYRLWMGTFHSIFARILRSEAPLLGWPANFTIYDKSDAKSALKACIKELQLDDKVYVLNDVQARISMAKNNLLNPAAYAANTTAMTADAAARKPRIVDIYQLYAQKCRFSGAMDFDDLLLYTNVLFRDFPEVLDKYRQRFSHILVDEYQDTNFAQYLIVKKLAQEHRNLCVVGDDSQSIYAFRGARIENILNFRKDFAGAREYKLEQNYRSTQTIVNAANSVIKHNTERLNKECFSTAEQGEKIEMLKAYTDQEEAYMVAASLVSRQYTARVSYDDFAILYRTNAQSRVLEESLRKRNIPYKIYGGFSFYERAEIKDMLAYLRLMVNSKDDEALKRVVNVPARGIGGTTLLHLQTAAREHHTSMWEQITGNHLPESDIKPAAAKRLTDFALLIQELASKQYDTDAYNFALEVATRSGYLAAIREDKTVEGRSQLENIEELLNSIKEFTESEHPEGEDLPQTIHPFLANVSLLTDIEEQQDQAEPKVKLMTIHSAKGLEFKYVYIVGMEENLFPSMLTAGNQRELEEERRLFYVALTRAKIALSLSYAQTRYRWGSVTNNAPSRFLKEIDPQFLNKPVYEEALPMALEQELMGRKPFSGSRSFSSERRYSGSNGIPERGNSPAANSTPSSPRFTSSRPPVMPPPRLVDPNFIASDISAFKSGQRIEHERFGLGKIISMEGEGAQQKAIVEFDGQGSKTLLLKYAKMKIRTN